MQKNQTVFISGLILISSSLTAQLSINIDSLVKICTISKSNFIKNSKDNLLTINFKPTKTTILLKYFDYNFESNNYDSIDSLMSLNYKTATILNTQRTPEVYGESFQYIIKKKNGSIYHDNCVLKKINNRYVLFQYSSLVGQYKSNINNYECILQTLQK